MAWLPDNYKVPKSSGQFMKLEDGTNRIRIMSKPVLGFVWWEKTGDGKKPHRVKNYDVAMQESSTQEVDGKIKHFWAFAVWNYAENRIQTLEITQNTIMAPIQALIEDEDWGSPENYDMVITKKGKSLETEYTVQPKPAKKAPEEALEAYKESKIDLEKLFSGGYPMEREKDENGASEGLTEQEVEDINDSVPF